ncbi:MAG TPA: hypothetical protein VIL20_19710 [Sandaracinaceae bacterium]
MADERRKKESEKGEDVALVIGASPDGEALGVLRKRGDTIEPAIVRRVVEGKPITGELVRLTPREEPMLFDVDVLYDGRRDARERSGPAQVATEAYRKGWDRLFSKKSEDRAKKNRAALN